MRTDIDALMQAQQLDAILVTGSAQHNPMMHYFTGNGHISQADLVKKRGSEPVLFYNSMERDEAAKTGLATRSLADYKFPDLLKQSNGDVLRATILRYQKMLADLDITSGRVAVYGKVDAGVYFAIFNGLQEALPGLTIVGEMDDSVLMNAMATKSPDEVERIRGMGKVTVLVVAQVADYLTSQRVKDDLLVDGSGNPITIGDVKRRINLWLAERGAENPEDTIFAIGRDAGVPHSAGNPHDYLRLGQTIVFDIFPCEAGGGYYYDFTRTWCLGYASDEAQALYEDVLAVYKQVMAELEAGKPCQDSQRRTCELFEARGHPTIQKHPQTEQGYVHSLGHGVGLHVHERPWFRSNATPVDLLLPGSVVTIEPGLYYPERGMGVRLEDTVWVRPDGEMETLVEYPLDLVLPVKSN
jgi:Xaa-Pro aminopeptidase